MSSILGIDLGTTNSCAAVVEQDSPLIIPFHDGKFTIASVVAFSDGKRLVGESAKRQSVNNAINTVFAIKRLIGRSYDDPQTQRAIQLVPYQCVAGPNGDVWVEVEKKRYAIQEICAFILAEIRLAAEKYFSRDIKEAVITVPAYFNDRQRQATKDAGKIAGLSVLQVVNEPTSAALAYGYHQGAQRNVAVYDLGGGTFDVSVLKVGGGAVEVLASAGDAFLGGHDFDNAIYEWLLKQIESKYSVQLNNVPDSCQRLREAAEVAKKRLSDSESTKITLPFLSTNKPGKTINVDCEIGRDTFNTLVKDLVARTDHLFSQTINDAGLTPDQIDEVLLVGGMTCSPVIRTCVEGLVECPPATGVHPDLVVAVGAAVQANLLTDGSATTVLLDVTPHNLGIMTVLNLAETIIPKNSKIPIEVTRRFATVRDNQKNVKIVVYQGDSRKIEKNEVLGEFRLEGLRPAPRGQVEIDVNFSISSEGIVHVAAIDVETQKAQEIQIANAMGLDEDALQKMIASHQDQLKSVL